MKLGGRPALRAVRQHSLVVEVHYGLRCPRPAPQRLTLPRDQNEAEVLVGRKKLRLTNLQKPFWPGVSKRDLLQYYADVSPLLMPHLKNRAMVMKRYPNGVGGSFFFMKRAPAPRPAWVWVCPIEHASGSIIDFPIVQDLGTLLWIVNLGCIDLNPWYARCEDVHRPDYLHFDLDPVTGATFEHVLESALRVREALAEWKVSCFVRTSGSRGLHLYVPIRRKLLQKQVWCFARQLAPNLAARYPALITAEYRVVNRPEDRLLVDYNQNAWGRTLASVYSVRPTPQATVSAPVTWAEVERGFRIEDFYIGNMPNRLRVGGDLWKPMEAARGRVDLEKAL